MPTPSTIVLKAVARAPRWRAAIAGLLAMALGACAAPQLAYQKLDWLASLKLGQYVDLHAAQERSFEADFRRVWDWHRATELGTYGQDLRELAQATQQPMSPEQVRAWAQRAETHSHRVLERAIDPACALLSSFDEGQRDSLLQRIAQNIDDDAEEYLDASEPAIREQARRRMRKVLERWIGDLNDRQEAMLDAWSGTRPQRYRQWIEERRQWRQRLAAVLEQRREADFCHTLQSLVLRPHQETDGDLVNETNADAWSDFLASFSTTLDERQRGHLRDKLIGLADDFEALRHRS